MCRLWAWAERLFYLAERYLARAHQWAGAPGNFDNGAVFGVRMGTNSFLRRYSRMSQQRFYSWLTTAKCNEQIHGLL